MIKTQTKEESKFLRRILAHYFEHAMTYPDTYITRFLGMHRIKMHYLSRTLHFVVMQVFGETTTVCVLPFACVDNHAPAQDVLYGDKEIHRTYDLKVGLCRGLVSRC